MILNLNITTERIINIGVGVYRSIFPLLSSTCVRSTTKNVIADNVDNPLDTTLSTAPVNVPTIKNGILSLSAYDEANLAAKGADLNTEEWSGVITIGAGWTDNGDGTYTSDGSSGTLFTAGSTVSVDVGQSI